MSATRPATEFSIGIMPRSASPEVIAANASSNVGQRIDAERHRIHDGGVDPHSGFQRPEFFELLALFQNGRRQLDEALQRLPPIGVEPDVMVARAVAVRRGGTGEIQGPEPLVAHRGAHELHDAWGRVFLFLSDLRDQRSDVYS